MSVEIRAKIICDGCGAERRGKVGRRTTVPGEAYWSASQYAEQMGWIRLLQYGPARHFCRDCADKPIPKKKAPTP